MIFSTKKFKSHIIEREPYILGNFFHQNSEEFRKFSEEKSIHRLRVMLWKEMLSMLTLIFVHEQLQFGTFFPVRIFAICFQCRY